MALTAKQRRRLPRSAFAYAPKGSARSAWKYPVPTARQAQRAGISEGQRQRTLRSAVSYSAHRNTASSARVVAPIAHRRARRH